jgi:predicted  nucleic acid-binding Zn-ribbon protein
MFPTRRRRRIENYLLTIRRGDEYASRLRQDFAHITERLVSKNAELLDLIVIVTKCEKTMIEAAETIATLRAVLADADARITELEATA